MPDFAELLKQFRQASGISQRALARAAGINPAIANRLESGDRGPSGPDQVRAIARALDLDPVRSDQLLGAAGFWPDVFLRVGPGDPTLRRVARLLARSDLPDPDRARFRQIVDLLIDQWVGGDDASSAP